MNKRFTLDEADILLDRGEPMARADIVDFMNLIYEQLAEVVEFVELERDIRRESKERVAVDTRHMTR